MENNQNSIAIVSVIVSGIVAISSVIFPIIVNFITDRARWKREQKSIEINSLNEATNYLLRMLANFRSGNVTTATKDTKEKAMSDIIHAFYSWERCVWVRLNGDEQDTIKDLRKKFETGNYQSFFDDGPTLVDKILTNTDTVIRRI